MGSRFGCFGFYSDKEIAHIVAQTFTFDELATATRNFNEVRLLGERGFGRSYMGRLHSTEQVVAVKQLDRNGLQGNRDFLRDVLMLSRLHHSNLVDLIGYCADGDQRLLVYEYMPEGSLKDRLHSVVNWMPLDWNTRMQIAAGVAEGLEYLHDEANPPVVYRDLNSSNILLGEDYHPKLSDFGLVVSPPVGDKTHVSSSVMGTYGYCAPEYATTGQLTFQSDVYSFGVVLLELITGRKAIENTIALGERNLVAWATPLFKDRSNFRKMVDPRLKGRYPKRGLDEALAVAAMCLQEQAATRPLMGDVVTVLTYLASETYNPRTDDRSEFESEWRWTFNDLVVKEPQRGSPASAGRTPTNRDLDRERAVAEAMAWEENWRKEEEEGECKVNRQLRER